MRVHHDHPARPSRDGAGPATHQHAWTTASRHVTSQGWVAYQSCGCGSWRVVEPVRA